MSTKRSDKGLRKAAGVLLLWDEVAHVHGGRATPEQYAQGTRTSVAMAYKHATLLRRVFPEHASSVIARQSPRRAAAGR